MTAYKLDSDLIQKKPGNTDNANFPHKLEENHFLNTRSIVDEEDVDNTLERHPFGIRCHEARPRFFITIDNSLLTRFQTRYRY